MASEFFSHLTTPARGSRLYYAPGQLYVVDQKLGPFSCFTTIQLRVTQKLTTTHWAQDRSQDFHLGDTLPLPSPRSLPPFLSLFRLFTPFSLPFPMIQLRGLRERCKLPQRVREEPDRRFLANLKHKIKHLTNIRLIFLSINSVKSLHKLAPRRWSSWKKLTD